MLNPAFGLLKRRKMPAPMKKTHLSVIRSLLVVVVGLIVSTSTTPEVRDSAAKMVELDDRTAPTDRPNILFILADDLGWHQLGSYGSSYYENAGSRPNGRRWHALYPGLRGGTGLLPDSGIDHDRQVSGANPSHGQHPD